VFREVQSLPRKVSRRIVLAVENLADDPMKGDLLRAEWKGLRRIRVSNYRVIYAYDGLKQMISVTRAGHRREVYR